MSQKLDCTLSTIDQANLADPNRELVEGETLPREYAYSLHMTRWLFALAFRAYADCLSGPAYRTLDHAP
jgi:hypothetical protein